MSHKMLFAKGALMLVFVTWMLTIGFGCSSWGGRAALEIPEGREVRVYEVLGMDCPGCHGGLEKLLEEIPAVETSRADWKEKQLTIVVKPDARLDDEDVLDAIRRANFTPGERLK
jgi:copper chaperone CopZ